jgi:hypothetical protein
VFVAYDGGEAVSWSDSTFTGEVDAYAGGPVVRTPPDDAVSAHH